MFSQQRLELLEAHDLVRAKHGPDKTIILELAKVTSAQLYSTQNAFLVAVIFSTHPRQSETVQQ